ncbi:MAG: DUF374 domain-containing protein [Acidobacteriota bacterium]
MQPVLHNDELYTNHEYTGEKSCEALQRLEEILQRLKQSGEVTTTHNPESQRNLWTRSFDTILAFFREHLPFIHRLGATLSALGLRVYARLVAFTSRLTATGAYRFPNLPAPAVIALWHGCAPSLLVAFAKHPLSARTAIMVARDARGDALALLCRWLGLEVVRGDSSGQGWKALGELARVIEQGGYVLMTADGGGPARIAKVGAVALASATRAPLIPLGADCRPAIAERHKWDAARNPVPFGRIVVATDESMVLATLADEKLIEEAQLRLQAKLNQISEAASQILA